MAVFRVERTRDYTVMSNYHLKDKRLTLKSKGLLSQMLSLPDDWDYTLSGLSVINRESKDAIRSALNELEAAGYIRRRQTTDASGKFSSNEYIIYERPEEPEPSSENPTTEKPSSGNPTQLNTKKSITKKSITDLSSTDSFPFPSGETAAGPPEANRRETDTDQMELYRDLIKENISYEILRQDMPYDCDRLDEIVELMVETVCSTRKQIRVSGSDYPAQVVKSRLLKLDSEHIRFVFDCLKQNTTRVRNIRQYLLAVLFNAPTTIGNYYSALVNHDMHGG
ncbi:DUF6017 domain-containing protein [Enterocloster asparagiformis]|uniref:DUF6017 domain-containing protein n=1 Tax=Enterocloster asparagiformis TaxID=333367 RepID=UPI0034A91CAC